jgi:hypothetical protein
VRALEPIRTAALGAMTLLLGGCVAQLLPEAVAPPLTFDFGPPSEERAEPLPVRMLLDTVTAPSWLETRSIYYRRLDEQRGALRSYATNTWIAPASELFAERLTNRLASAAPPGATETLWLRVEILRFEHVYTGIEEAYVVAGVRAAYDGVDGRPHVEELERRRPATAAVGGATEGLPQVADEVIDDVLAWVRRNTAN